MPKPPEIVVEPIEKRGVKVTAIFRKGLDPEMNELHFSFNRSEPYTIAFEFDEWSVAKMTRMDAGVYEAEVKVPKNLLMWHLDVVTLHRHVENNLPITFSGPYCRMGSF